MVLAARATIPLCFALPALLLHQFHGPLKFSASVLKSEPKHLSYPESCSTRCRKASTSSQYLVYRSHLSVVLNEERCIANTDRRPLGQTLSTKDAV